MEIYITRDGSESGPFTEDQVKSMHVSGLVRSEDLIWHAGLEEWIHIQKFLGLKPALPIHTVSQRVSYSIKAAQQEPAELQMRLAGPVARLGAYIVDYVLGLVMSLPFILVAATVPAMLFHKEEQQVIATCLAIFLCFAALFVPRWLYHSLQESSPSQATFGKKVFGLRVTDLYGGSLSRKEASRRFISLFVTELLFGGIFFIAYFFSEKRQCLHDQYVGALVVKK